MWISNSTPSLMTEYTSEGQNPIDITKHRISPFSIPIVLLGHHKGKKRNSQEHQRLASTRCPSKKKHCSSFQFLFLTQPLRQQHVRCRNETEWTRSTVLHQVNYAEVQSTKGCHRLKALQLLLQLGLCERARSCNSKGRKVWEHRSFFWTALNWEGKLSFARYFSYHFVNLLSSSLPHSLAFTP